MAYQFNTPTVAGYPTSLNRTLPVVTITQPSTTVSGLRNLVVSWTSSKPECQFKWSISNVIPWTTVWAANTSITHENIPNGNYVISVKALDKWGNESVVTTKNIEIRREIVPPTMLSPLHGDILPTGTVTFRCSVPRNETGDVYHYAFQILEETSANPLLTKYVDSRQWFDSRDGFAGFSFTSPVPEDQGGEVSFTKTLDIRKNYWWCCRISTLRAGVVTYSVATELQRFTTGVLATKLLLLAEPGVVRADSVTQTTLRARAVDPRGQLDVQWSGTVNFQIVTGTANFVTASVGVLFVGGVATTRVTAGIANTVNFKAVANKLLDATVAVQFVNNRLPAAPAWKESDDVCNLSEVSEIRAKLAVKIPTDADNDLIHMRLEFDTEATFDSPDRRVAETRFSTVGWTYFDGVNEVPFPASGVPQGVEGTWAAYETGNTLVAGKRYFCRASAWDNWRDN